MSVYRSMKSWVSRSLTKRKGMEAMGQISYNLVDEGWIPCLIGQSGTPVYLSLLETLRRAPEIRDIADASPLVTVALHRLLLAVLHRNFGPENVDAWRRMWESGRFDMEKLERYFEQWHERFDLFAEERPFYQVGNLDPQYAVSA